MEAQMTNQEQYLIYETIHATAEGYTITIPQALIEQLNLKDGDKVAVQIMPMETFSKDELIQLAQASWEANKEGYLYLKGR
jgi:antitoxin component of MazEF toxin-antitoxin module